ncbi:MAG TPA: DegT/DnrJ/EryC1/StrS family aminotransferase [Gemmatimonadales bacterium]|nr:DegT/DnrJ/EryC1/StrS family aminotransferase [Gemmatimonadales bacterium]
MAVPLMDIRGQYEALLPEIKELVCDVIESGRFILGPNVRALEEEVSSAIGYGHAVAVGNGTDALELALNALGIGPGDEVVTSAYTFYATAEAIARTGAVPVFADIDADTLCLDPAAAEAAITERTRAIVPVHIFGQPADLDAFRALADRHGIALIEDAAQAFGATFEGYQAGSYGDVATFSFFPTKNFPAMGDAGMAVAASEDVAERLRMLRFHGSRDKKVFEQVGVNSRLDEMQAAILRRFLPEVPAWNEARRAVAERYRALGLGEVVTLPVERSNRTHVYHLYVVRTGRREALHRALKNAGIGAAVYYEVPLHRQPVFEHLGYREGSLPVTEAAARDGLALPMFPTLTEAQQREVVDAVKAAVAPAAA